MKTSVKITMDLPVSVFHRVDITYYHMFFAKLLFLSNAAICIHRIASVGSYGFRFVTSPPPQCVERFHRYRSNEKNVIANLLKLAGYIHNHKILPGNIFGLILKNKMAARGTFVGPLEQRVL